MTVWGRLWCVSVLSTLFLSSYSVAHAAGLVDTDGDGLTDNYETHVSHTDPTTTDTDGDDYTDYQEIFNGYSPRDTGAVKLGQLDTDGDDMPDSWEIKLGTGVANADTDGDGYTDGQEITAGHNPLSTESTLVDKKITVSLADQSLAYFFGPTRLEEFPISSGVKRLPTPTGTFTILDKVPVKIYGGPGYGYYYPNTKWNLHFTTKKLRYYIHGAYWHHNFGHPMSHGCVNVDYAHMERLYDFAQVGTRVEIE